MSAEPIDAPTPVPSFELIEQVDVEGLRVVTVRAALELDIFSLVAEGHDTEDALIVACGAGRRGMHRLVAALRSLELLELRDGRLHNSPTADAFLRRGALGDVRANYLAWLRNRDHLVEAILDDEFALEPHDQATWASYARADLVRWPARSETIATVLAQRALVVPPSGHVLDVGCGSGLIGYTAIRDVAGATTISIDSAPVLEVARDLANRMGIADRVRLLVGNTDTIEAREQFDLAFLVQVAQYLDDDALDGALDRILTALHPGGTLLLVSIVDDAGTPGFSSNWTSAIEMLLSSPGISLRTPDQLRASLVRAGFSNIKTHEPWAISAAR